MAGAAGVGALTCAVLLLAGSLSPDTGVRDALWVLGFSGLTTAAVLLMRTVAQSLHGQPVHSEADGPGRGVRGHQPAGR